MPRIEPASPAQQGMWFLHQLAPGSPFYNVPMAVHFDSGWNVDAVSGAVRELVRRHEALRVSYSTDATGVPMQVIADELALTVPHTEIGSARGELERLAQAAFDEPFDLSHGPLLRAHAVTTGPDRGVLLITIHHSVCDHWSLNLLARELRLLARGEQLPPPPAQYSDFARWQQASLRDGQLAAQLDYWRARLERAPAVIDLPLDRPRTPAATFAGGARRLALGPDLSRALDELARREGASLFMVLLAAFDLLLHRVGRQSDVVVGTWIAGRSRTDFEQVVGAFANTLLVRTDVSGNPTFRRLLSRVREGVLEAMANQDVRIETLVRELAPPRTAAHMPLCQVVFSHQNFPEETLAARRGQRRRRDLAVRRSSTKYDLVIYSMGEGAAQGLELLAEYSSDLFDDATIGRLLEQYQRVLEQVAADPKLRVASVALLRPAERRRIVVDRNRTEAPYPRRATVDGLFREQAARAPGATALRWRGHVVTAADLDAAVDRVAAQLSNAGVSVGDVVGVCGPRCPELIAGMLGVMRAGAAYLPLDPAYPEERLTFMLTDSRAKAVLVAGDPPLPATAPLLPLEGCFEGARPAVRPRRGELAYIVYTSGSTGVPKGVMGRHRATVNRLVWQWRVFPYSEEDICVQKTAISFVDSVAEIFGPLLRGVPLVILDDLEARDPFQLLTRLAEERVTRIVLVPSLLRMLLDAAPDLAAALPGLRICVTSGEALSAELAGRFKTAHPSARLLNLYGSSEVAADATFHEVSHLTAGRPVPIGRPIANTAVYVLDGHRQPVPVGSTGEIWVAGDGLAAGYLHRPDLTGERFLQLDLDDLRVRAYRTGDLGRLRRDGSLEFAGRADHQLKMRGIRVEPGEVEVALRTAPGISGALVVGRGPVDDLRLVAYLETPGGREVVEAAREAVRRRLPAPAWPAAYVTLPALPLTPNGKINRAALPPPPEHDARATAQYESPRSPREAAITKVFADVLDVAEVGIHDHFFELGGHSLTAIQATTRIRDALGVEMPLSALFEEPTAAGLALRLEAAQAAAPATPLARDNQRRAPLSFAQRRLWFLDQLQPGSPAYHIAQVFKFEGDLPGEIFERALNEILRRHDALRTSFESHDGEPVQVIAPDLWIPVSHADLRAMTPEERRRELRRLARDNFALPFDLAGGPLLRATLARIGDQQQTLFLCVHHIVADGWSMELLDGELRALVAALAAGEAPSLPDLPIQYADLVRWQRTLLQGDALETELRHWRGRLAGAPAMLNLPTDRPRPAVQSLRGERIARTLPGAVRRALDAFARTQGVTSFMVLLAAFTAVLARWSGQDDIVVGSPIAGRTRIETEPLIGFFVNTLALRADLAGDPSFAELVQRVRTSALDAYEHQDLPFERLVEELAPDRDLSRSPLFQVMFVLQNARGGAARAVAIPAQAMPGDLRRVHWAFEDQASKFDLTLTAIEWQRGLKLQLEYATDLFSVETMERLLDHFTVLLDGALAAPASPVSRLPLLAAGERAQLERWSAPPPGRTPDFCLHDLFEQVVNARPQETALVYGQARLTYLELDARANRAARRLAGLGVKAGDRVGICMERTPAMVETVLATLKLGAAYVPLDPHAPAARHRLILEDAGARVCVATAVSGRPGRTQRADVSPSDVAYVLYTSGSTGRPKGVEVEHRQVAGYSDAVARATGATAPGIRYAMLQPLHVDSSVTVFWGSLLSGGELHLIPAEIAADADRLAEQLKSARIDFLKIAPSHLRALHAAGRPGSLMPRRWLVIGGEGSGWEWVRTLPALRRGCRVFNHYGPTEATVGVTIFPVNPNLAQQHEITPIGRPLANARALVLDVHGRAQPVGVPGELYVGGPCVARGYCGLPELTAERFVPDPNLPGGRLYRTGDLCRWLPGGDLEFLGRLDHQVKIRGFRIELGEVEAALKRHPGVGQALALARDDARGDRHLVAWVAGTPNRSAPSAAELRHHLHSELPEVMVPAAFVILDRLPLSSHGKVDVQALPAPRMEAGAAVHVLPRTESEAVLAGIWSEVLGLDAVGAEGHFFELGGHSLLATQVISRVRDRFQVEIPLRAIFEQPTLAGLAGVVDGLRN